MMIDTIAEWARKIVGLGSPRTIAGVEIDGDIVRVVYARDSGGAVPDILRLAIRYVHAAAPAGEGEEEDATESLDADDPRTLALRDIIETEGIKPDMWLAAIPATLCITKHLTLPSTDEGECEQMIRNHAVTLLPLDEDEIVFDHRILHRSPEGYSRVELSLIQRSTVEEYVALIHNAGIELDVATTGNEALYAYCRTAGPTSPRATETPERDDHDGEMKADTGTPAHGETEALLFVDIDFHHVTLLITMDSGPIFTRTLHTGAGSVPENGDPAVHNAAWIESVTDQVRTSLKTAFQHETDPRRIAHIYISGAAAIRDEVGAHISRAFATPVSVMDDDAPARTAPAHHEAFAPSDSEASLYTAPVDYEVSFDTVPVDAGAYLDTAPIDAGASAGRDSAPHGRISISSVLGLLRLRAGRPINLLPPSVVLARQSKRTKHELRTGAVLIAAVIVLSVLIFYNNLSRKERYLDFLNQEIAKTRSAASELSKKQEKIRLINEHIAHGRTALEVITEVYRIIPPNVKLTQMSYSSDDIVSLKGEAPEMSNVIDLTPLLERSTLFRNARVKYATRTQRTRNAINFEITLNVR